MNDITGPAHSVQRSRIGPAFTIAIVALVVGLALMAYAMRRTPGFFARGTQPAAPAAVPSPQPMLPSGPDAATLALRESALAAQLSNLEARAARIDTDSAGAAENAGKAEAILVTFAARRALERGVGLGYIEAELRERFGGTLPREVNAVIRSARAPVTLEDLREGLTAAAPTLLATQTDWWAGVGSELRNLIVVHRAGTPSPLPSDRLVRARRQLEMGNVEAALAEVQRLPGAAQAGNWTAAAGRWIDSRRALDMLEAAAITGVLTPAPAPEPARQGEPAR